MDELILDVAQLTNGLVAELLLDVLDALLPVWLLVLDVLDVLLLLLELLEPDACWLAVAWSAAKIAADERFCWLPCWCC